ncbi:PdaC/SigV domain-containing protein [Paenibacillus physcomitrellae]|nr:DUF4163 domain-containing protein [Paenibacillus physcomitrellae]
MKVTDMNRNHNRNHRKWSGALLAAALLVGTSAGSVQLASAASASASNSNSKSALAAPAASKTQASIHLMLNGKPLAQKALAGLEGTLIPLGALRDSLGFKVTYDAKTKTYQLVRGNLTVQLAPTTFGTVGVSINGATQFPNYEWINKQGLNYVSVHLLTDNLGYRTEWNNATKTVNLLPFQLNSLKVTANTLNQSDKVTNIQIQYPVISGLANTEVQEQINKIFKDRADAYVQDSLKRSKDLGLGPQGAKNEFDMYYTVTYNRNGYLSFRMLNYDYTGGAHGMSYLEGFTFRLSDGKQVELTDLLKANPDFVEAIDAKVGAKLNNDPGYFGGFKTVGDKPGFYLKDDGLVTFFQLYEYLPYAAGFPEYYLPFSSLLPKGADPLTAEADK